MAFYLGGAKTPKSDPSFNAEEGAVPYMVQGLLFFDKKKQSFSNASTVGMNHDGTVLGGFLASIASIRSQGSTAFLHVELLLSVIDTFHTLRNITSTND